MRYRVVPSVRYLGIAALGTAVLTAAWSQPAPPAEDSGQDQQNTASEHMDKRILGVIPNFRTTSSAAPYQPISARAKFTIAARNSFDRGTVLLAALAAAHAELVRANPPFGQGWAAYGRYFAATYGDAVVGNFMTQAVFPSMLHQDPRYFRHGTGSKWSRVGFALRETFWVHNDSGRMQFNYSEILGNSTVVAISEPYHSDPTASHALVRLGLELGLDAGANVLKEFSNDINRKLIHRRRSRGAAPADSAPGAP